MRIIFRHVKLKGCEHQMTTETRSVSEPPQSEHTHDLDKQLELECIKHMTRRAPKSTDGSNLWVTIPDVEVLIQTKPPPQETPTARELAAPSISRETTCGGRDHNACGWRPRHQMNKRASIKIVHVTQAVSETKRCSTQPTKLDAASP